MVVMLEDEMSRELPTSVDLYKPVRQAVYSVLLNLNKLKIIHDNQSKDAGTVKHGINPLNAGIQIGRFENVVCIHFKSIFGNI